MTTPHVTIEAPDYAQNHRQAPGRLRAEAAQLRRTEENAETIAALEAAAAELVGKPAPTVRYYTNIPIKCRNKYCPTPDFTASFPEVWRIIICPSCGAQADVPEANRGRP
jgi:hypothetical protein